MLKIDDSDSYLLLSRSPRSPRRLEGVQCFVGTDELRRLLCLMAGTELLLELCKTLSPAAGSARKVKLPPALL